MKINQKYLNENVQTIVDDALKQFNEWGNPEDIYDKDNDEYSLMVEIIAADWRGVYQPDTILPGFEPFVEGLAEEIEDAQKETAKEEGEEYDPDHPPELSWDDTTIDLVDRNADLIADALNAHPVVEKAKLRFFFGHLPDYGDYGLTATMDPAAFKALRKSGTKPASTKKGAKKNKQVESPANQAPEENMKYTYHVSGNYSTTTEMDKIVDDHRTFDTLKTAMKFWAKVAPHRDAGSQYHAEFWRVAENGECEYYNHGKWEPSLANSSNGPKKGAKKATAGNNDLEWPEKLAKWLTERGYVKAKGAHENEWKQKHVRVRINKPTIWKPKDEKEATVWGKEPRVQSLGGIIIIRDPGATITVGTSTKSWSPNSWRIDYSEGKMLNRDVEGMKKSIQSYEKRKAYTQEEAWEAFQEKYGNHTTAGKKREPTKELTKEQAEAAVSKYLNESERYEAYAKQKGITDVEAITYFIKKGENLLEKIPSSYKKLIKAMNEQTKMLAETGANKASHTL